MYCIHYLWFNNLPSKLVMCHGQFWQVTNHISLVLKKKKKKKKKKKIKPDTIESLLKSCGKFCTIKQDDIPLTKQD